MMQAKLILIPDSKPDRVTAAWFIPGSDSQTWLNEMTRWQISLSALKLLPIPRSNNEIAALGVLVVLPHDVIERGSSSHASHPSSLIGRFRRSAQPYQQIAGRLFIPLNAAIFPEASDAELRTLLPSDDCDFVWHPSAGLIRIESDERLGVSDLLAAPRGRDENWSLASPGVVFQSRLLSVEPDAPMTVSDVLSRFAEGIGSQGTLLDKLPPTPDEWFGGKLNQLFKPFRGAARKLMEQARRKPKIHPGANENPTPKDSPPAKGRWLPSWLTLPWTVTPGIATALEWGIGLIVLPFVAAGAAAQGLTRKVSGSSFVDQLARNREIDRLMHLLKTDPDAGLRFALPMTGTGSSGARGTSVPSNRLVSRDISFNLGPLGSGGPADLWDIPPDQQAQLLQHYRELALREIRLGRYRRAAYIYAELLGDMNSAASTLENGGHFREAATLYREKLNRPVDAANCLERAGLLDQAAELFIEAGMFEKAADLYVRLERHDEAETLLRSYAAQLVSAGHFQAASRILHDKLHDIDGALATLARAWPSSSTARACVEESFRLMGQNARHEDAHRWISDLQSTATNRGTAGLLAHCLSNVYETYPESTVRLSAADTSQIVVARFLGKSNPAEAKELLSSMRKLAPQDRLLARDCDRFVKLRQESLKTKSKPIRKSRGIETVFSFSLSIGKVAWRAAKSTGKCAYVAGYEGSYLILQRIDWDNTSHKGQRTYWTGVSDARRIILEPTLGDAGDVIVHPIGMDSIDRRGLPSIFKIAGSPKWATGSTVAMAYSEGGIGWRVKEEFGSLVLTCFSPTGEPSAFKELGISFESRQIESIPVSLSVCANAVTIGVGAFLMSANLPLLPTDPPNLLASMRPLEGIIQCVTAAQFRGQRWLCVLFETGGLLIEDSDVQTTHPIADGLESPCSTFLNNAYLVLTGSGEVQAYEIVDAGPVLIGQMSIDFKPIAVTGTNKVGTFAIFGENGLVKMMSLMGGELVKPDFSQYR